MYQAYSNFEKEIEILYDDLLMKSFSQDYWIQSPYNGERIKWTDIDKVKIYLPEINQSGLYIWGHGENPIYIGKTVKQSFRKRFSRYIFSSNSQCKLGEKYRDFRLNGGEILSLEEICIKYNLDIKKYKSRAMGVKSFGEFNDNDIWFILVPLQKEMISVIEILFITIGIKWNKTRNMLPLINLDK